MVGIKMMRAIPALSVLLIAMVLSGCVSTEELYAEYDAFDCKLVATTDAAGATSLHEQNTDTRYPWEPAVYFEFDSSELDSIDKIGLTKSMQVLKDFPRLSLGLQGFTDKRGSNGYNKKLAEQRVLKVKRYLEQEGIAADRMILQPIGEALPQVDPDDAKARAVNRRVELSLLDDMGRPMPLNYTLN